ncbi:response regulator [Sphingorhabdus sp. EL138]|jgi:DNA-binding response OmpR family regulator|uniref:response regulator n=1 Tax=Sphingorhabdus sp. EL138 TaxID=2073156 RepID=UPI0025D10F3D|nr:response regulator [Sphingorhabdus sp. EL138]
MNVSSDNAGASSEIPQSHVLLIDDEQDVLPEYQEFLEFAGFAAFTSADPVEAYERVLNTPEIGVVVTDLRMAKIDGASLIRKLRAALPAERHVGFIILTGDASTQMVSDIADVPVFLKPADTDALIAAIRFALVRP